MYKTKNITLILDKQINNRESLNELRKMINGDAHTITGVSSGDDRAVVHYRLKEVKWKNGDKCSHPKFSQCVFIGMCANDPNMAWVEVFHGDCDSIARAFFVDQLTERLSDREASAVKLFNLFSVIMHKNIARAFTPWEQLSPSVKACYFDLVDKGVKV